MEKIGLAQAKIGSREFFRNPYRYLEKLPLVVTKRGWEWLVVTKWEKADLAHAKVDLAHAKGGPPEEVVLDTDV